MRIFSYNIINIQFSNLNTKNISSVKIEWITFLIKILNYIERRFNSLVVFSISISQWSSILIHISRKFIAKVKTKMEACKGRLRSGIDVLRPDWRYGFDFQKKKRYGFDYCIYAQNIVIHSHRYCDCHIANSEEATCTYQYRLLS